MPVMIHRTLKAARKTKQRWLTVGLKTGRLVGNVRINKIKLTDSKGKKVTRFQVIA